MEKGATMIAELETVKSVWPDVKDLLSIPKDKRHYNKLVKALDELIDEIGENEKHHLVPLMETIGSLIEYFENEHLSPIVIDPIDVLKSLMVENGLNQKDLPEIGSQGVVSEVLNGKRLLNTRQIRELSSRFNISPAAFI
jgi:HTH-type transcriptional regulator / antitoxin HigA